MVKLNHLGIDAILFVVDGNNKLIGSLTDGDIRRGLLEGKSIDSNITDFIQSNPKFIRKNKFDVKDIIAYRNKNFKLIPVIDDQDTIVQIINFRYFKSYLPIDAVLMAGGKGERLKPLTDIIPKPLLKVGNKPILEHNIDNLTSYGIDDFHISIRYLGDQIEKYFGNGASKNISIDYIKEDRPLGTAGSLSLMKEIKNDYILLSNSDILTTLNYEDFFIDFLNENADLSIFSIPYTISIPLGVLDTDGHKNVTSILEKPSYTYYSNSGIYLMKREIIDMIPKQEFFNATDLVEAAIKYGKKVISYQSAEYWLDIGSPNDYEKAQKDILHLKF